MRERGGVRAIVLIAFLALAAPFGRADDIPVLFGGKEAGHVYLYKVGEQRYLNAKQAIEAYGGRFAWHPVSKKIQLSVRGRQAQLAVDSTRARVGDTAVELPEPVIVRANTVLVPVEFFSSPGFGDMTWTSTTLAGDGRLEIQPKASVGPLRWFTHRDYTRVVLPLDPQLVYSVSRRGRSSLDATIPLGAIGSPEQVEVKDRIVEGVRLSQEPKRARLSIELAESSPKAAWDARVFDGPRRLVIDVYPDADALKRSLASRGTAPPVIKGDAPSGAAPEPDEEAERASPRETLAAAALPAAPLAPPAPEVSPRPPAVPEIKARPEPAPPVIRAKRRIVIDPGHGGHDSGATGRRGVKEKTVNLAAAKELARLLREDGTFEVLLTREDDTFVPLAERSKLANDFGAELFVSLHCNANRRRAENGFEIYFLSERASDPEAEKVAEMENASLALEDSSKTSAADADAALLLHAMARTEFINEASVAAGVLSKALARKVPFVDRGVKQAAFYVLRGTSAPAVLVEMGFVSNPSEESKLDSYRFRRKLAEGIYSGILDFARRQEWKPAGGTR